MSIRGIDVSDYQPNVDWKAVVDAGITFAFIKATEGESFVAELFNTYWKQSKANGLLRGAYHFFRPSASPQGQAYNFLATVKPEAGDLPPVLDIETTDGLDSQTLCDRAQEWIEIIERESGFRPIIYTYPGFWQSLNTKRFSEYPLWIAHYTTAEQPLIPGGWKTWLFWQFTDKGEVTGVNGGVDVNLFEVSTTGATGSKVEDLQSRLKNRGFDPGSIDGIFGNGTKTAVSKFQKSMGLSEDGIADLKTWTALLGKFESSVLPTPEPTPEPTPQPKQDLIAICKAYKGEPRQNEALKWLQQQILKTMLLEFTRRWRNQSQLPSRSVDLIDVCKYYRELSTQDVSLRWLQRQIPIATWEEFEQKWNQPQVPVSQPDIRLVDVCQYYQGSPTQKEALEWLQTQIPSETLSEFAQRWRKPNSKSKND
ncbi:GH25 family lysozyme [Limnoraphis robusta]|uniref:GH25 family lysozyme n=1 Tax=Limnoraphis robusta TaxID=1118279 RepID=UPI002B211DBC|nr:GH25 family lysozyme [Limnoraphis robusta]MEA5496442.1 GH25 family lysozyme [Limnoraphis robusta BA-68 BA1]